MLVIYLFKFKIKPFFFERGKYWVERLSNKII